MTKLNGSPLRRETSDEIRYRGKLRPLVVELRGMTLRIGPKGTQLSYAVSYEAIYHLGGRLAARLERAAKPGA